MTAKGLLAVLQGRFGNDLLKIRGSKAFEG
jgi:hypothetical protein